MPARIFLSSTFVDLADHRKAVQSAIRQLGAIDVSMEILGARDERPADECVRLVKDKSDLFVGIYAHRYGYIPDGSDVSVSEMEYNAATEASLPRFIYIVDQNLPWVPAHIDSGDARDSLLKFKTALTKKHICQVFGGEDHLAAKVVADVGRHLAMQAAPKVGPGIPVRHIGLESMHFAAEETADEWNQRRNAIYAAHRRVFLTHVIRPSSAAGQTFDIFIYLIRHNSTDLSDISHAEFFLGPYWENKVFPAVQENGFIGISTSAYGTFLCVCRVTFRDGHHIFLERLIDFEAAREAGA
jgi:hypothetical protein